MNGATGVPLLARSARLEDAPQIARIYNEGILERIATFETELRSAADVARALAERAGRYPAVVVERGGGVIAFAWASGYRSRSCYDGIAEFSVYVSREARGKGAGRAALAELARRAEEMGFWKLVSRVFPENRGSRALCAALGFREVGVYRRHARLDGKWRDCVIVEKLLGEAAL